MAEGRRLRWVGNDAPNVLFISDYPRWEDAKSGTFASGAGVMFKKITALVRQQLTGGKQDHPIAALRFHLGYAAQCGFGDKESKEKPTATDYRRCFWRDERISQLKPDLIVPMGKSACQAIGLHVENFHKVRGRYTTTMIEGKEYKVYPTLHPAAPYVQPGLVKVFMSDLRKALLYASTGTFEAKKQLADLISGYKYPRSHEELEVLSKEIIAYADNKLLAVDSETNTLDMHLDTAKCIAVSVAWDKGKSAAWLMNHRALAQSHGIEEWWKRLPYVFNILMCPKPKALHHAKFDRKVWRHLVKMLVSRIAVDSDYVTFFVSKCPHSIDSIVAADGMVNFAYDSMLAEHALNEDLRGYYNLKSVVNVYCPEFYGYEETLRQEKGPEYQLKTITDFKNHVMDMPEYRGRQSQLNVFARWMSAFTIAYPDNFTDIPPAFEKHLSLRFDYDTLTVSEVWESAKSYIKPIRKAIRDRLGAALGEARAKLEWKNFDKKADTRKGIYQIIEADDEHIAMMEWYLWYQSNHKKDLLRVEVARAAKELQIAVDLDRDVVNFEDYDPEDLLVYANIDTDSVQYVTHGQIEMFNAEEAEKPSIAYKDAEPSSPYLCLRRTIIPASSVLSDLEYNGVALDYDYIDKTEAKLRAQEEYTHDRIFELTKHATHVNGNPVNLGSTDQLAKLLWQSGYSEFLTDLTPKGKIRVSKDVLSKMSKSLHGDYFDADGKVLSPALVPMEDLDLAQVILLYRESIKARTAFLDNFRKFGQYDGKLHPSYHQTGTVTTRLSATKPALQTIPQYLARQNIKSCMMPSSDEFALMDMDAAGCELRVAAAYLHQMTGEHRGQSIIRDMNADPYGYDMHSRYTAMIFAEELNLAIGTPDLDEAAYHWVRDNKDSIPYVKKLRTHIKRLIFSLMYGSSEYGVAHLLSIPLDESRDLMAKFYAAEPGIPAYIEWASNFAITNGYINNILGAKRRFPLAQLDKSHMGRTKRQSINFLIQSLANLLWLMGICRFAPVLRNEIGGNGLITVHDSFVFEVPKSKILLANQRAKECFSDYINETCPWFPVPFIVEVGAGPNYGKQQNAEKYAEVLRSSGVVMYNERIDEERDKPDLRLQLVEDDPDNAYLVDAHGVFEDDVVSEEQSV